jgi:arylsulfatase A-like enzyme
MRSSAAAVAGSTLLSGCLTERQSGRAKKRPNLLFVFSDQQSRDMLGCYGNKDIITPNLDKFAGEGIRFDHCVSVSPVCTPFRGMLLSGMHPLYNGAYCNDRPLLTNNGKHFPHVLAEAGYRMGYVGKWHLLGGERNRPIPEGPLRFGFDDEFLSNNCHVDFRPGKCYYWNEQNEKVFFSEWEAYGQTRQAMNFLDDCDGDQPFAMFISWHPPHDIGINKDSLVFKYDTIGELMDLYDPEKITLRPSAEDTPDIRRAYHGYYAMCTGVDKAFGQLMDKLKEKGLDDNTIVVFTSDHGDNLTSYGYHIAKDHPEDTATRIPFLMRLPGGQMKGKTSNLLLGPMDMMPTILSLMDLPVPNGLHGADLSKAILDGDDDAVDSLPLFFFNPYWSGVYTRDVTYGSGELRHFASEKGRIKLEHVPVGALYDRRNDPYQLNNLFDDPKARQLREKMEKLTRKWQDHFSDPGGINAMQIDSVYKMPDGSWPTDTQADGFPGRPIDLISKLSKPSK